MAKSALVQKLEEAFPGSILESTPFGRSGTDSVWIEGRSLARIARGLRGSDRFSLDVVENLSVMEIDQSWVLTYFLRSWDGGKTLILRVSTPPPAPSGPVSVASLRGVWPSIAPYEEEIQGRVGLRFEIEAIQ